MKFSGIIQCRNPGIIEEQIVTLSIGKMDETKKLLIENDVRSFKINNLIIVAKHEIKIVTSITEYAGAPNFNII